LEVAVILILKGKEEQLQIIQPTLILWEALVYLVVEALVWVGRTQARVAHTVVGQEVAITV
jgi:hypothetical protein